MSRPEVLRVRMALNPLMMVPGWRPSHHLSEAQQGQVHLQHLSGWLLFQGHRAKEVVSCLGTTEKYKSS